MKKYIKSSSSTKPTTFEELAKLVAADFVENMQTFDFETFEEMAHVYDWTSKDIKDEVEGIIRSMVRSTGCNAYIDAVDGSDVFLEDKYISYRAFSRMFRKYIQEMTTDNLNRK